MRRILLVALFSTVAALAQAEAPKAGAPKAPPAKPPTKPINAPPLPPSTEDFLVGDPAHAAWVPSEKLGLPKGAQVALIGTDPVTTGATVYLKTPAGWHTPLHWHTHTEYVAFVSGKATFTVDGKAHELVPGVYVVVPGKLQHELTCAAGSECLLLIRRAGPADINWVSGAK